MQYDLVVPSTTRDNHETMCVWVITVETCSTVLLTQPPSHVRWTDKKLLYNSTYWYVTHCKYILVRCGSLIVVCQATSMFNVSRNTLKLHIDPTCPCHTS